MKEKLLVVCPGRGTYNATELGYLKRHHSNWGDVTRLDGLRTSLSQPTVSELDGAEKFSPSVHMPGHNASLLIYAWRSPILPRLTANGTRLLRSPAIRWAGIWH